MKPFLTKHFGRLLAVMTVGPISAHAQWSLNGNSVYYNGGSVGIGTANPSRRLQVEGGGDVEIGLRTTDFGGRLWTIQSSAVPGGPFVWEGCFQIIDRTANASRLSIMRDGQVGIGTIMPGAALQVGDITIPNSEGMIRLASRAGIGQGSRYWDIGVPENDFAVDGKFFSFVIDDPQLGTDPEFVIRWDTGNVGIGTTAPRRTLHVQGHEIHSGGANAGFSFSDRTSAGFVENPNGTGERWVWYAQNGTANLWSGSDKISIQPNGNFRAAGSASVCSLEIRGGCDLAEPFEMSGSDIPKGSLVVIDEENAGKLRLADREYDMQVAGIVSGANGLNPGISLHQQGLMDGGQHVALSGRVYALADASYGAIKPGDLLTSSITRGHVRKVTDHMRARGAIVGKAMSPLKEGKGMVLVLVTLQ